MEYPGFGLFELQEMMDVGLTPDVHCVLLHRMNRKPSYSMVIEVMSQNIVLVINLTLARA